MDIEPRARGARRRGAIVDKGRGGYIIAALDLSTVKFDVEGT